MLPAPSLRSEPALSGGIGVVTSVTLMRYEACLMLKVRKGIKIAIICATFICTTWMGPFGLKRDERIQKLLFGIVSMLL
jgi:hypothetical protein